MSSDGFWFVSKPRGSSQLIPATQVGLLLLLETVLGPIWIGISLKNSPTFFTLLGGTIILLSLVGNCIHALKQQTPNTKT